MSKREAETKFETARRKATAKYGWLPSREQQAQALLDEIAFASI